MNKNVEYPFSWHILIPTNMKKNDCFSHFVGISRRRALCYSRGITTLDDKRNEGKK